MLLAIKSVLFACSVSDTKPVLLVYMCKLTAAFAEVDRVLGPQGKLIDCEGHRVHGKRTGKHGQVPAVATGQWEVRMT